MGVIRHTIFKRVSYLLITISLIGIISGVASTKIAYAATFTVTKTDDTDDGVCDSDCSVREAIRAANARAGDDTIILSSGTYTLTIPGPGEDAAAMGDLDITDSLTIKVAGAGNAVIKGGIGWNDRVFHIIGADTVVHISNITVQNGTVTGGASGGGILNYGILTISSSTISHNNAGVYPSFGDGGGVSNMGILLATNSTFSNNTSSCGGGGISGSGVMTITNSNISNNMTSDCIGGRGGGGIQGNDITIINTTIVSNTSSGGGGGLHGYRTVTLLDSTISGNTASGGGGIFNQIGEMTVIKSTINGNRSTGTSGGIGNNGTLTMTNSTVSGNLAQSHGGGIGIYSSHTLTMNNVTVADNLTFGNGGGIYNPRGTVNFKNTIVAKNSGFGQNLAPGCLGTMTSFGYNLVENTLNCTIAGTITGNIVNVSSNLDSLQDNGGPTLTHALLPGSPAIDAGNPAMPGSGNDSCEATDQRDITRPQHTRCDIGAFESQPIPLSSVTLSGPASGIMNTSYTITAAVTPITATIPITYQWQATGQSPLTNIAGLSNTASFTWSTLGMQVITVTVNSSLGISVSASSAITIAPPPRLSYLPTVFNRWPPIPYKLSLDSIQGAEDGRYTISWTEAPERLTITFTLQEATDAAFTSNVRDICITEQESCGVQQKVVGTYYYRARGLNKWGYGEWSDVQSANIPMRGGVFVNTQNRQDSLNFFNQIYLSSEGIPVNWTGNHGACDPGSTDMNFRDAVLRRINYFRAMAGVPADVTLSDESNRKAQAAALMMSVNRQSSHNPPSSWICYSEEGAQGAGSSNLYLGVFSWTAITGYIMDPGGNNYPVGHRRWILYPQTQIMGTGDVPPAQGYPPANALRVFDSHMGESRPPTREEFVAWPPPGYVPYQVVFPRWSFSSSGADFSAASVSMISNDTELSVSQADVVYGYGENTLVWVPTGLSERENWSHSGGDTTYSVNIRNVVINNQTRDFAYDVIVFDPGTRSVGDKIWIDSLGEWTPY